MVNSAFQNFFAKNSQKNAKNLHSVTKGYKVILQKRVDLPFKSEFKGKTLNFKAKNSKNSNPKFSHTFLQGIEKVVYVAVVVGVVKANPQPAGLLL